MELSTFKDRLGDDYSALESYVNTLTEQRDAARKESQQGRQSLKTRVETLEALKARLFDRLGLVNEEEIDSIPDAKALQGQTDAVKQLEARLKRMENDLSSKNQAYQELQNAHRSTRLDAELNQALAKYDFVDPEIIAAYLKGGVKWEGEEPRHSGEDGALMPLAESVTQLAQTRPQLLKTSPAGGSGWRPQSGTPSAAKISRSAFDQLSPQQAHDFLVKGGSVTD
jgi:hypothetical protein